MVVLAEGFSVYSTDDAMRSGQLNLKRLPATLEKHQWDDAIIAPHIEPRLA